MRFLSLRFLSLRSLSLRFLTSWIALWSALLLTLATGAFAQVTAAPSLMNFQGRLTKPDGTPVADGTYSVRFSLWNAAGEGTEKWSQTVNPITVRNGTFAALLSGFPADTFAGDLWLEIKIGDEPPLTPRQQLLSVAYAMKANSVPDGSIGTAQLADGGVNSAKIANDAISAADILSDPASLSKVSGGALTVNSNRLFVPNGVLQRGGSALTGTQDLGLYSQVSGNWIRFVTNNARFQWYSDSGIGTNPLMTLLPSGNLGIGTSSPAAKVQITDGAIRFNNTADNRNFQLGYDSAGNYFYFEDVELGVRPLIFQGSGVGLGTTVPQARLHVENATANGTAVKGRTTAENGKGIQGEATATTGVNYGVYGTTANLGAGVSGRALNTQGNGVGVWGISNAVNGFGVLGETSGANGYGVFSGGRFGASGTKSFRIDHPADPQNKYLLHYCAEGPEPLNIYSGNVTTDQNGEAWVTLPAYFEAINRDVRYSLTIVDESEAFVQAKVWRRIAGNRFAIKTSRPGVQVSWEIKAVRNDRYVQRYGAPVEIEKPLHERGKYQHPELYEQPVERGVSSQPALQNRK